MINQFIEFISQNSDTITSLSAIIISGLAIYGVREWKRQIKGKTEYEIARRLLRSSLKLRDAIKYVRNPFIPVEEMKSAVKEQGFNEKEYEDNNKMNLAVYSVRWKKVQEAWTNLEVDLLEAEVSWGDEPVKISRPLTTSARKLFSAIQLYLRDKARITEDKIIYNQGSEEEPDDFTIEVNRSIEDIRKFLKHHLD